MKKKKLMRILVTVIWAALLVLLAVFQMPYEVNRMVVRYESETPLDASQLTFRYESDGDFGYDNQDGYVVGGGALARCYTDTSTIDAQNGGADFALVNLNSARPDQIRLDNCGGAYDITLTAVEFYQGDRLLYSIQGEELGQVFTTNEQIQMTQTQEGLHLVAQDSTQELADGWLISQPGFAGLLGSHTQHYSWYHLVMALVYTLIWVAVLFGSRIIEKLEARPAKAKS